METVSVRAVLPSAEVTSKTIRPSLASALVSALPSVTKGLRPWSATPLIPVMISPLLNLPAAGEPGIVCSTLTVTPG
jgi:hypothetical protein